MAKETDHQDVAGQIGSVPACEACGSERIVRDASACWNPETGLWEIETVLDQAHCHQCDSDATLVWTLKEGLVRTRVRELNDLFRTTGQGNGSIMITSGIQEQGAAFVREAIARVRAFDMFTEENDPWGEHDFGAFDLEGQKVYWKIDAYDLSLTMGSPNPANDAVTKRVLTILLASEY